MLLGLAAIPVLGVGANWLAWRSRVPAILPLLLVGLCAGPGASATLGYKLLDPDALFGDLLLPAVSLAVAVILFEGGLSLRRSELKDVGHVVRNLCSFGVLISWGLIALAGWGLGLLAPAAALLLGAILSVTGPTVIGPILQHVRLRGPAATVLRWEGIVVDPIGAVLALLVFEVTEAATLQNGAVRALGAFLKTSLVGGTAGLLGGTFVVECIRRHWCPDFLENAVVLMVVVGTYAASNTLQDESGLLAVTTLGLLVANRLRAQELRHVVEFKENLKVLLISCLFVLLAARLGVEDLRAALGWRSLLFVAILVVAVRPLSVLASTVRSQLTRAERTYVACMAPRGIVACAVSAVFALRLAEAGHPEALALPSITVLVILVTVSLYGLASVPLARRLGLAEPDPRGLLMMGAHRWAREMASALQKEGVDVLLIDSNETNVAECQAAGLRALHANALSEYVISELDLGAMGRMLAMTPNDEVNSLATERLGHLLGRANVFQLAPRADGGRHDATHTHRVRYLFGADETFRRISERFAAGAILQATRLTPELTYARWRSLYEAGGVPLFVVTRGRVAVFSTDLAPLPKSGDVLVSLLTPRDDVSVSGRLLQADPAPGGASPPVAGTP